MSGWLLMGLPGLAYWTGLADGLDGHRPCSGHLPQLAYRVQAAAPLQYTGERHHHPDFSPTASMKRKRYWMTIASR